MHGLLAIAALHLFEYCAEESDDRRKYLELATRHQNLALSSFRPQLSNITPSNCQAVFAFSSLIAALAFAFSKSAGNIRAGEPVEQVLQDFFLFRGVEGVLTAFWDIIRKGKLGPLVHRPSDPTCSQPISRDVINALDYLHDCNGENVTQISAEEKAAYNHAIRELRISFERSPSSWETAADGPGDSRTLLRYTGSARRVLVVTRLERTPFRSHISVFKRFLATLTAVANADDWPHREIGQYTISFY
ncbi:hypothetical protein CISG_09016 [Coccidioides immitis RMSCC 3703]|uniref:Uncharacterized protein n=1 Tax=Coccidioides immitis RMSCC 3703 TaxID=454286 RepID=A0A0J8RAI1_COCIT|nr:hypothetical protein CISG_09016 [Coccidioides immitis RMSCC 3703]